MENEREVLALQHQVKAADEQGQAPRYGPGDALNPIVFIAALILRFESRGGYLRASRARPRWLDRWRADDPSWCTAEARDLANGLPLTATELSFVRPLETARFAPKRPLRCSIQH